MTASEKKPCETSRKMDSWFLMQPDRMIVLNEALSDLSIEHNCQRHREDGRSASSFETKLIVEKLVTHDEIASRAFGIFNSGVAGSPDEQWFRAERELLSLWSDESVDPGLSELRSMIKGYAPGYRTTNRTPTNLFGSV